MDNKQEALVHPEAPALNLWFILRDIVILVVMTGLGGIIVGIASGGPVTNPNGFLLGLVISNVIFATGGFVISGCLVADRRMLWKHLGFVALGAWLFGIINVAYYGTTVAQWFASAIFVAVFMCIGGGISILIKRRRR